MRVAASSDMARVKLGRRAADIRLDGVGERVHARGRGQHRRQAARQLRVEHGVIRMSAKSLIGYL